ncbi:unnamed protein product [Calypogeia fissa]
MSSCFSRSSSSRRRAAAAADDIVLLSLSAALRLISEGEKLIDCRASTLPPFLGLVLSEVAAATVLGGQFQKLNVCGLPSSASRTTNTHGAASSHGGEIARREEAEAQQAWAADSPAINSVD